MLAEYGIRVAPPNITLWQRNVALQKAISNEWGACRAWKRFQGLSIRSLFS